MTTEHPPIDTLIEFDARVDLHTRDMETHVGYWDGSKYNAAVGSGAWDPDFVADDWREVYVVPKRKTQYNPPSIHNGKPEIIWHPIEPVTVEEGGRHEDYKETHPAFGAIAAHRVTGGDSVLFDSDIKHHDKIVITLGRMTRNRSLHDDSLFANSRPLAEVEMSLAQWASFVSSMNSPAVPCTIRRTEYDFNVPGLAYEPRLQETMDEVAATTDKVYGRIVKAMATYDAMAKTGTTKEKREALNELRLAIGHVRSTVKFAADSLTEHAEAVVQKARADIESMVVRKAAQLEIDPSRLGEIGELGVVHQNAIESADIVDVESS